MKKVILMAMAVAAMTACNKTAPEVDGGQKQKLNILTSIGNSRAVVAGTSLPQGSVIGVHVTEPDGGGVKAYLGGTPGGVNLTDGQNVRFDNIANANVWVSHTAMGTDANLMIGANVGTVYAYYPYTATVTGLGTVATIPATVLQTGNIVLAGAAAQSVNYDATEVDYLYYKDAAARKTVSNTTTTTAPLTMEHAMASVSFRMYVSNDAPVAAPGDDVYHLMGYTIKNKTGKTLFRADNTNVTMNIADGTLTVPNTGGQLSRTINAAAGYALTRVAATTADQAEKDAMVWASNLVFPIATIANSLVDGVQVSDDIEVIFSIRKGASGTSINYAIPLTVVVGTSDTWEAGKNYQYTVKLNGSDKLGIETVTVTNWVKVVGGDMEIK